MNCRDLARLVESRSFGSLTEVERRDGESHATGCRHCAPAWIAYARVAAVRVPPMPPELAARCRSLAAARPQGSVLRFAPRSMMIAFGGLAMLAAAAGVLTAHLASEPASQPAVQPPVPQSAPITDHVENGEPDMNKSRSIAVTAVALGAAAATQVQAAAPVAEPRHRTAEEIIAANDLNGDGIVTKDEAAKVNGNLHVMWSDVYDMDLDGRIDLVELKRAMSQVQVGTAMDKITGNSGGNMAAARPEAILASNDLNKDGVVTRDEARTAGRALIRMWDSYDLNTDGVVELAELARAQGY